MKKNVFTLGLLIVALLFVSCDNDDDDVVLDIKDLPAMAKTFIDTHFPNEGVKMVSKDDDSYDVYLENGFELDFYLTGDWDSVDGRTVQVPESVVALVPEAIPAYLKQNYADQFIVEVNKEHFGFEIKLNNRVELEFDKEGKFLRIDK